jgi:hypothetical protein
MLDGLKPALAKEVESAFAAVPKEEIGKSFATRAIKGQEPPKEVSLDSLVPRVDLRCLGTLSLSLALLGCCVARGC